jgi:nucleotide-binding universal stress UspA family protein
VHAVVGYVVVGVTARQPSIVVQHAARFARRFEAVLVCAHVDQGSYVVTEHPDGSVQSRPIDPDQLEWKTMAFERNLASRLRALARAEQVAVEFRELAGETGQALGRLAEVLDAEMIVVGTRRGGVRTSVHEFFGGSVAIHLAHRQPRPVVVIPLTAVAEGTPAPWEHQS